MGPTTDARADEEADDAEDGGADAVGRAAESADNAEHNGAPEDLDMGMPAMPSFFIS